MAKSEMCHRCQKSLTKASVPIPLPFPIICANFRAISVWGKRMWGMLLWICKKPLFVFYLGLPDEPGPGQVDLLHPGLPVKGLLVQGLWVPREGQVWQV